MKVRLAAVMSLSGVLVAGSAAALVNTQILNHSANFGAADIVQLADATPPGFTSTVATLPTETTLSGSSPLPRDTTIAPGTFPPASTQAVYQVGDAGMVTLDTAGDALAIVVVVPNSNWIIEEARSEDPTNIEVKFQSTTTLVEFHATLLFGVVGTSIESKSLSPASGGTGNATATTTASSGSVEIRDDDQHEVDLQDDHEDEDD